MNRLEVGLTIGGVLCFVAAVVWACCWFPLPGNEETRTTGDEDPDEPITRGLGLHDSFVRREETVRQIQTPPYQQDAEIEMELILHMLAQEQPPDADPEPPNITHLPSQQHSPENALPDLTVMPLDQFMELKQSAGENLDPCCSICLAEWSSQDSIGFMPNCMHGFHSQCIATWLSSRSVCPLCRAPAS